MKSKLASIVLVTVLICAGLLMLTEAGASAATAPEEEWSKTFGGEADDGASSVQQTSDGGYIIVGSTESYSSNYGDIWLIKTDSDGNKQWDKTFEKKGHDGGISAQQTSDGGYIITGVTRSSARSGEPLFIWLIKTDSKGNKQWDTTFETIRLDQLIPGARQTSDGGYILAGWTTSPETSIDGLLIKFDENGKQTWIKSFGGKDDEWISSVQQTMDGGYILAGASVREQNVYAWLVKTDSSGDEQWSKTLGGGSSLAYSVQQTTDGGYIFTGKVGRDTDAAFLIKTDGDGNQQWVKTFGDKHESLAWSVQQTFDGGYVFTGLIAAEETDDVDIWVVKTDSDGNMLWDRVFGGTDAYWARSVQQTSDGGYILAGYTESYGAGSKDVWIIKLEGTGEVPGVPDTEKTSTRPVAPAIEKLPEKSIPGFDILGGIFAVIAVFVLIKRRSR
jgi:hypothetical protein